MEGPVFALDIGTQSVTGILLNNENETYEIIDFCTRLHKERTMLDGQIQHVAEVAELISEVKTELEEKHGTLTDVCVAAAGRALKTISAQQSIDITEKRLTTGEEIRHLELSAVQQALSTLTEEDSKKFSDYHCVGYSVLRYKLDDESIISLLDQVGETATVEVIATFLPKVVVESLLAALERANLTMKALTLEPIAAIHVLIPESMRRLNVALIDIGAGTSDIAISNDGTIIAYGMVPHAGDEITEAISDTYLLDFKVAEQVKKDIVNKGESTVQDILGFDTTITHTELIPKIDDHIDQLAQLVATEVRDLNGKSPQAVMLIGGGSLTPRVGEKIATYLQLPSNRVAIRGTDAIEQIEKDNNLPTGPDFVTPVGIAISATQNPLHYMTVHVNGQVTFLFQTKRLTVGDALVQAGIDINRFYGKIGLAKIFTVNNEKMTIRGEYGEPPKIFVNNELATVETIIEPNDQITIEKGENGSSPHVSIEDVVGKQDELTFYWHDEKQIVRPIYYANKKQVDGNYIIQDKDFIEVYYPKTVRELVQLFSDRDENSFQPFHITVNKQRLEIKEAQPAFFINDQRVTPTAEINENDSLSVSLSKQVTVATVLAQLKREYERTITVQFNGEPIHIVQQLITVKRGDTELSNADEVHDGDELTIVERETRPFIFQDVFRYVDIDLAEKQGVYTLYRNDEAISFHEPIMHGDELKIVWE